MVTRAFRIVSLLFWFAWVVYGAWGVGTSDTLRDILASCLIMLGGMAGFYIASDKLRQVKEGDK